MKPGYPKPLKDNSTIGLICPAGGFNDYKTINLVRKYLNSLNYKVKLGKSLIAKDKYFPYLSGTDKNRLSDFMKFWLDPSVDAVFCLRGGYGCLRILEDIDFLKLKTKKKILLGFSDITILLLAIYKKCNLITFHGPLLGYKFIKPTLSPYDKHTESNLWTMIKSSKFNFNYKYGNSVVLKKGVASGRLIGGNLTDIVSMIGTDYLPDFSGAILFIEDCFEEPYRIDRMLTQLINTSLLKGVRGIIVSSLFKCKFKSNLHVSKLIEERLGDLNIPIIYNFPIGHDNKNYPVPIGKNVILDTNNHRLYSPD